eukprot:scaffold66328_cov66-Cyclotella_meneghiniana.AAC.3
MDSRKLEENLGEQRYCVESGWRVKSKSQKLYGTHLPSRALTVEMVARISHPKGLDFSVTVSAEVTVIESLA